MSDEERAMTLRLGSVELDVPESIGFFGGIGAAVCLGLIEPPLGVFIAAVPLLKMLDLPRLPFPVNVVGHVLQGAAKPVGGDSDGTIRVRGDQD